jgi:hypothetical protein
MMYNIYVNKQRGCVFAAEDIPEDGLILRLERNLVDAPDQDAIRIDADTYQLATDDEAAQRFLGHSCRANAYIDFDDFALRAKRAIGKNAEITINYCTVELEVEPFECRCHHENCYGTVRGFKYLAREEQERLRPWLSPFVERFLDSG